MNDLAAMHRQQGLQQYNTPGWEVVRLAKVFKDLEWDTEQALDYIKETLIPWCTENVPFDAWSRSGVTVWSYRFLFRDPQDALAFRLTFGL